MKEAQNIFLIIIKKMKFLIKIGILKSIIKLLLPYEFIYPNLNKDFSYLPIEEEKIKLIKTSFFRIILLEIQMANFILKIKKDKIKNFVEYDKSFEKGDNLIEKLVYFMKLKFSSNLGFNQFKLMMFRIRRKGNKVNNLDDYFLLNTIKGEENINKIKEIKLNDLFKLEDIILDAKVLNSMLNDNKIFVDENPFHGFVDNKENVNNGLSNTSMGLLPVICLKVPEKTYKAIPTKKKKKKKKKI